MIGNDIVDLKKAGLDSNWKRKGYLDKICTSDEQQLILQASEPAVMLWLIWSMKEAAYKIIHRKTGIRLYEPLKYICDDLLTDGIKASGKISYLEKKFYSQSEIKGPLLHSSVVSALPDFENLHLQYLRPVPDYNEVFNRLSAFYQLTRNRSGLPEMVHIITGQKHAVSVSHHGSYLAVIYSDSLLLAD